MRELIVIRHAIAHERNATRWPDDGKRPLTGPGRARFRKAARGICAVLPQPDELLVSPLVRARQTAKILQRIAGYPRPRYLPELAPQARTQLLLARLSKSKAQCIAIVGHEPALSRLLCELLRGRSAAAFTLKKGGIAWLGFTDDEPKLLAHLAPKILRRLA